MDLPGHADEVRTVPAPNTVSMATKWFIPAEPNNKQLEMSTKHYIPGEIVDRKCDINLSWSFA